MLILFRLANFDEFDANMSNITSYGKNPVLKKMADNLLDPSLTWEDVKWLRTITHLPIVLKGILTG